MRVSVTCSHCAAKFTVREEFAGKCVHCKRCQKPVDVPEVEYLGAQDEYQGPPLTRTGLSSTTIASTREAPKGSSRRKKKGSNENGLSLNTGIGVGAAAVVVLIIAVAMMRPSTPALPPTPPASMETAVTPVQPIATPIASTPIASTPTPQPVATPLQPIQQPVVVNEAPVEPAPVTTAKTKGKPELAAANPISLPDMIARVEPAVIRLEVEGEDGDSLGSGYIIHEDGTAVTNYHVITGARTVSAIFADGAKVPVVGYKVVKPRADIAVIKLALGDKKVEPISLSEAAPQKGVEVVGFGAPQGLSFTTSTGIISGLRSADLMAEETGQDLDGLWIQTTCPISQGSSGGPLTDRQGRIVAMNSMIHRTGQNLNFAISAADIAAAIAEAQSEPKPFIPSELQEYERSIAKKNLTQEIGTPRGTKLMAGLKNVAVVDPLAVISDIIDPKELITSRIDARARGALEHRNLQVATPGTKAGEGYGLMIVILDFEDPTAKRRSGTQMLIARSALLCRDPEAKGRGSKMCVVWRSEEKLGTMSMPSLMRGQIPKGFTFEEKLLKLFNRFEAAHRIACTSESKGAEPKEANAKSGQPTPKKTVPPTGF